MSDTKNTSTSIVPIIDNWLVDYYKQKHQDPIYGEIDLMPYQQRIVATPHFNRLRDLKQMGAAHHVFTNAHHTRFSHSVGVAHLAKKMYRHLTAHSLQHRYNALEEMLLTTAAMCHDLGHGPHSHSFECWANGAFDHEQMSVRLVHDAIENDYFPFISEQPLLYENDCSDRNRKRKRMTESCATTTTIAAKEETNKHWSKERIAKHNFSIVRAMILGASEDEAAALLPKNKYWLFEIVHNSTHGIDVDKMDYLVRDMHSVYGSSNPNVRMSQIIDAARIINGRIRFNVLACNQLYEMLYLRASMHKNVYTHDSVVAIKHMFLDLLHLVDKHTQQSISTAMKSTETFLLLSDSVFHPWFTTLRHIRSNTVSALTNRIQTQQYYAVVARRTVFEKPSLNIDALLGRYKKQYRFEDEHLFTPDMLFITCTRYDLGNGTSDPLRGKIFYRKTQHNDEQECYKTEDACSCFYDNRHTAEYLIRLFYKRAPQTVPLYKLKRLCACFANMLLLSRKEVEKIN